MTATDSRARLERLLADGGFAAEPAFRTNASGLKTAWLVLEDRAEWPRFAGSFADIGGRLATATVHRPQPVAEPAMHEVAFHLVLDGLPVTVKLTVREGDTLRSVARRFPNADWEEREMMELAGLVIEDQPNPRRLFLDESIAAGVFDRLVPYSEFTNSADHATIWARIREQSRRGVHAADDAGAHGGSAS